MQRVGQTNVVNVMGQTLDQSRVFGSFDSFSNVLSHDASM
jgi:hypothetical protein